MISIIVPIYKVEKYVNQCIDSILNQTYRDLEIILVDDGSPDNCPAICDEYAKIDSRIKVVHKENGGLMSARQAGLNIATGDYIGFVDGDDWIEANMYEYFAASIEKYHPDMVCSEFYYDYPDRSIASEQNLEKEYYNKKELIDTVYPKMLFNGTYYRFGVNPCCWSKVYKKELLEKCLYKITPKIKIGEDVAFTYPCLIESNSISYVDIPQYHYRENSESMTNVYDSNLENTIMIPIDILKTAFESSEYNFSNSLSYYILYMVNGIVRNEANKNCNKSKKEKKQTLRKFAENADVINAVKSVDYSVLPIHTKFLAKFFAGGNVELLYWYSMLLRRFL